MTSLGIRCSKSSYAYVVLEGELDEPHLIDYGICRPPADATRPGELRWLREDVLEIIEGCQPDVVLVRTIEGNARTKQPERAQFEGVVVALAAQELGDGAVYFVRKQAIKKLTGFEGLAKYVDQLVDDASLDAVKGASYREAALAALAGLGDL